ncbi:hypothetical protein J7643_14445 [bacterium]|nr:hypothetical protein [bacterium]
MIKKILPLALCGLMAGCAAIKEFQPLQSGLQTFFVRSLVVAKPEGGVDKHAFLIWASTGDKISDMKRSTGAGSTPTDAVGIDKESSFYDDQNVSESATYVYGATFGAKTLTRQIKVMATTDAGTMNSLTPNLSAVGPKPTFGWAVNETNGKPSGFLLSVVKVPDGSSDPMMPSAEPVYTAFLDATAHPTGVTYGTPSDMTAITKELLEVLAKVDPKYAKKENDQPLAQGSYGWVIAPIAVDKEKASFAIGTQAAGFFTVAP